MGPAVRAAWRAALPGIPPLEPHQGRKLKQPSTLTPHSSTFKLKLLNPKLKRDEQSPLLISTPSLELSQPIQVLAQARSHDSGPSPGLLHWL